MNSLSPFFLKKKKTILYIVCVCGCILDIPSNKICFCVYYSIQVPLDEMKSRTHRQTGTTRILWIFFLALSFDSFQSNHTTFHMDTWIHTTWTLINCSDTDTNIIHITHTHTHARIYLLYSLIYSHHLCFSIPPFSHVQ